MTATLSGFSNRQVEDDTWAGNNDNDTSIAPYVAPVAALPNVVLSDTQAETYTLFLQVSGNGDLIDPSGQLNEIMQAGTGETTWWESNPGLSQVTIDQILAQLKVQPYPLND